MNKTKIEWCDYTINPIKGVCKHGCPYCYATRMYKRYKWNPKVRYEKFEMYKTQKLIKKSNIFVCSTHDIMGEWIPDKWIQDIIDFITVQGEFHTYMFLSKNPSRYADFKFLKNCWLGSTATQDRSVVYKSPDNISFISFEPLLQDFPIIEEVKIKTDWIIIGGLTPKPKHKKEWVDRLIKQARKEDIPIFLKDNLHYPTKIKEFPK